MSTARDLKLDVDGDLFVGGGTLALTSGVEAAKQGASMRLGFFLGDWFLDLETGIPWFQRILIKNPNFAEVREWVRLAIIATPDIATVDSINLVFNKQERRVRVLWAATMPTGETLTSEQALS